MIKIPTEAHNQNIIGEGKPLKVRVEFSLEDPKVCVVYFKFFQILVIYPHFREFSLW